MKYIHIFLFSLLSIGVFLFLPHQADATNGLTGDVVDFAPSSNWHTWIVRNASANSGRGQTFMTGPSTNAISSIALKVCRTTNFTQPKTLTMCSTPTNGWYGGCQNPIATRQFSAQELNTLIPYDANCPANNEGGNTDGTYYKWSVFTFATPATVTPNTSYFFLLNSAQASDNEINTTLATIYNNCNYLGSSADYTNGRTYYYKGFQQVAEATSCDMLFKVFSADPIIIPFDITSPVTSQEIINDTWVTVTGTCPINGTNRIGFTDDCLGFEEIEYETACVEHKFSAQFYHTSLSDRIIAREKNSVSGDCVDYDNLMDYITVSGIEFVDGYPEDWYFNFGIYNDYDIVINSPSFDTLLSLPRGTTEKAFSFGFRFPTSSLNNLTFKITQYDHNGNVTSENFHTRTLASMADTNDYTVTLTGGTDTIHYVVQLLENSTLKRQYPFGIHVSDFTFVANPDEQDYFFPRIVEELRNKIVFNYYFAFHDGFYNLFNGQYSSPSLGALDITFKSVSGNGQYNIDMKIFSASDPRVRAFASGIRPYVVALLWLSFATYVVFRVTHLFSDNE